jgi:pimeloyl-ACP methyl ester carboxylesterase
MFNGYPGKPSNFPRLLKLGSVMDQEIAADRMPPAIVAIPTVYEHRSSECVDAANGGERDETYLAVDVPADIASGFRTATGRAFGALGYSEGGFCAANLGLHHPDRYAAVVSLSGYFTAGIIPKTVRYLYGRSKSARDQNSPLWWVEHRRPTGPSLLLMSSAGDPGAVAEARRLRDAARRFAPRLTVVAPLLPQGGHNFNTWLRAFPACLDFLGDNLPSPLAPALTLPLMPGGPVVPALPTPTPAPARQSASPQQQSPNPNPMGR